MKEKIGKLRKIGRKRYSEMEEEGERRSAEVKERIQEFRKSGKIQKSEIRKLQR